MSAARFYSNYPGTNLAALSASFILDRVGMDRLAHAVVLVPTRRAATALREAFRSLAGDGTLLLPRMISLADVGDELLTLLGPDALPALAAVPPAMDASHRLYLLTAQVLKFEERPGGNPRVDHAMKLAEYLADLQDRCVRAGVSFDRAKLHELAKGNISKHWQQSAEFLNIVGSIWPQLEAIEGRIASAAHEVQVLQALQAAWANKPPSYPVFAVGSTASQKATRALLSTIAALEQGYVILPGLDPRFDPEAWDAVHEGHPYFHLKQLLDESGVHVRDVQSLGAQPADCSVWLEALCRYQSMGQWATRRIAPERFDHLRLISCQHAEEEARVIALLMREGLEKPNARIALITPDESLMERLAAHLAYYGVTPNRLSQGTLAQTESGSVLTALMEAIAAPESVRALVQLLRHRLVQLGDAAQWLGWLDLFEQESRGISSHALGHLPPVKAVLRDTSVYAALHPIARAIGDLHRSRLLASQWTERLRDLLVVLVPVAGQAHEKISDVLEQCAGADLLGPMDLHGFSGVLGQALSASWRGPQFNAHPQLVMLTPVEARLQSFDRVILGNMVERLWPGMHGQSPWLNLLQQKELGLPSIEQHATLIAHDVLMHGSCGEVFLTYPLRDAGSPMARSRFIERLVALHESQGLDAARLSEARYNSLATARFAAPFTPAEPPRPTPDERFATLAVSLLDKAMTDPFSIYARGILGLRSLDELDAEPEAKDFGTVAHKAFKELADYWTDHGQGPDTATLHSMGERALQRFADRPAVQLFWSRRLAMALQYVNGKEAHRRGPVAAEQEIIQAVPTQHGPLQLKGKIDRIEGSVIVDHKTGKPPEPSKVKRGEALQLLAYALMRLAQGHEVSGLEYWGMPSGKRKEKEQPVPLALEPKLQGLLDQLMDPATAFLARPGASQDRFANDYDGISRYDEWAG